MDGDDENCVTERLCKSRRETLEEKINGIKRTIYVSSAVMTTIILIVQFILQLVK